MTSKNNFVTSPVTIFSYVGVTLCGRPMSIAWSGFARRIVIFDNKRFVSYDTDIGALSIDHVLEGRPLVNAKVFVYIVLEFFIPASVLGAIIYALATVAPAALGWLILAVVFIMHLYYDVCHEMAR
ncbi:MAG: hypothetical protein FWE92_04860 [Defluviitaleaceae bacterium]|nr:hypothetical protein [Defluviitaleaceae bacterium]